jgi:hypothetical protein
MTSLAIPYRFMIVIFLSAIVTALHRRGWRLEEIY